MSTQSTDTQIFNSKSETNVLKFSKSSNRWFQYTHPKTGDSEKPWTDFPEKLKVLTPAEFSKRSMDGDFGVLLDSYETQAAIEALKKQGFRPDASMP